MALLDVAKAFPSVPQPVLMYLLEAWGTPQHVVRTIADI